MIILMLLFLCSGVLLAAISIPMIMGKIPPNGLYGFRVKKTMENPEIWYPVNAYSGKWLLAAGLVQALAAVVAFYIPGIYTGRLCIHRAGGLGGGIWHCTDRIHPLFEFLIKGN